MVERVWSESLRVWLCGSPLNYPSEREEEVSLGAKRGRVSDKEGRSVVRV